MGPSSLGAGVVERRVPLVLAIGAVLVLLTVWASYALHQALAGERGALTLRSAAPTGDLPSDV